jgi:hypothetical protein
MTIGTHITSMTTGTMGMDTTTMLTISTSRATPPFHSVAMGLSRFANFKTSSTINCPKAFFVQKASFGLTKVKSATFFTWLENASPLMTATGMANAKINWC